MTDNKRMAPPSQKRKKKQRVKQAEQEAKRMLKIERAKQAVQKGERNVAQALSALESARAQLHTREEALAKTRDQSASQGEQAEGQP